MAFAELAAISSARSAASIRQVLDRALGWRAPERGRRDRAYRVSRRATRRDAARAAGELRDRGKGRVVTYSRKVFLPVTNLCRDRCTYCTFRKDPGDPGAWTMMPGRDCAMVAARPRARMQRGADVPRRQAGSSRSKNIARRSTRLGARSTIDYVARACEVALDEGLLPHTNAGLMSRDEMVMLRPLNVSMGLMLENVSPRLRAQRRSASVGPRQGSRACGCR